jgi:hypothetical protein
MNKKEFYVYQWTRLDTNEVFYVGKGKGRRMYARNTGRNMYFKNIVAKVDCAVVVIKGDLTEEEAFYYETKYIYYYRDFLGFNLVNMTDGGEGNCGFKPSRESIRKGKISRTGIDVDDYKEDIVRFYVEEGWTAQKIAEKYNVTKRPILDLLKRNNVETRDSTEYTKKLTGQNRYNAKFISVKNVEGELVGVFDCIVSTFAWLKSFNKFTSKKIIRKSLSNNQYSNGLLFEEQTEDFYNENVNKISNKIDINYLNQFDQDRTIVEVYKNGGELLYTYGYIDDCCEWLIKEKKLHSKISSAKKAIGRYQKDVNIKYKYFYKRYNPSEYFLKYNKII